jgi:hypothetical protein
MNLNDLISELAAKVKQPGFWQNAAGQIAIAYGSNMISVVADEAQERARLANEELAQVQLALTDGYATLVDLIDRGEVDQAVIHRAKDLGYVRWKDEEPAPGEVSWDDIGPPDPAPNGKPDTPPRMAGGYLAGIAATVPTTAVGNDDGPEWDAAPGPTDAPYNKTVPVPGDRANDD